MSSARSHNCPTESSHNSFISSVYDQINLWILSGWMVFHSALTDFRSKSTVREGCVLLLIMCPIWSQKCLIGFRSGDVEGHGITSTLFSCTTWVVILAVWSLTLFCWSVKPGRANIGPENRNWINKINTSDSFERTLLKMWIEFNILVWQ